MEDLPDMSSYLLVWLLFGYVLQCQLYISLD